MNGIEILSSEIIYNGILPEWCFIAGIVLGLVSTIVTIMCFVDYRDDIVGSIFGVLVLICMIISVLSALPSETNVDHIEYKVTIDDSVSMNEFLDKYEILDQEGKIYTVKERE